VSGTTTKTLTNHYDDASGDNPAWVAETADASTWTANVTDLLGSLAVTVDQTGSPTFQYANVHGDIQATSPVGGPPTLSPDVDEYGNTPIGSAVHRYGWLGAKKRSSEDQAGLILMGVRLYNPQTGRFLQTDPVPGGSANNYDYCDQDPLNAFDLDGRQERIDGEPAGGDVAPDGYLTAAETGSGWEEVPRPGAKRGSRAASRRGPIKSYGREATNRSILRDYGRGSNSVRHGVSVRAINNAVRQPVRIVEQSNGTTQYIGRHATVVLNSSGRVVTMWANSSSGYRY
jgi:RHS repeat-associated protein